MRPRSIRAASRSVSTCRGNSARARMSSNRRTPTKISRSTWNVHLSPRIRIVREIVQFSVDQRIASGTCSFIARG
jgi:hypothetical protein